MEINDFHFCNKIINTYDFLRGGGGEGLASLDQLAQSTADIVHRKLRKP